MKHSLCQWINEKWLPNEVPEPGFPRHISHFMVVIFHDISTFQANKDQLSMWKAVWVFDLSSRHKAMAANALDASKNEHQPWWQATGNVGHRLGKKGGEDVL